MTDQNTVREELTDEINRTRMGHKKFNSESSSQRCDDGEKDKVQPDKKHPGVLNVQLNNHNERRRAVSQPGPAGGNFTTATAARAARKRIPRSALYADSTIEAKQSPKYLASPRFQDDFDTISGYGETSSPSPYNNNRNIDSKSLNSYRLYAPNDYKVPYTPSKRSMNMDAQSVKSMDMQAPPPTSPEKNKELTIEYLSVTLSCIYGILLVTLGIVIFLADPFTNSSIAVIYNHILTGVGFIYMLVLVININRFKAISRRNHELKIQHQENIEIIFREQEIEFDDVPAGERNPDLRSLPAIAPAELIPVNRDYYFSEGRHSGSFYLKLGATGFAFGHLVHSVLVIAIEIGYIVDEDINNSECINYISVVHDFINPFYGFFQLYFVFKYSNVIILRGQVLARFGFMHLVGSSICFWVHTIVRETVLALTLYAQSKSDKYNNTNIDFISEKLMQNRLFDIDNLFDKDCEGSPAISSIYRNFSPYLYPFSVEFHILIVAVYYIIWINIGNHDKDTNYEDDNSSLSDVNTVSFKTPLVSEENYFSSNKIIYADCHASNRGLFLGLLVLVLMFGALILGFVFNSVGNEFVRIAFVLGDSMRLFLHVCMLLAVIIAFNQTRKLDISEHPISLLDDVLLFISLPAFFIEISVSMVATISILNIIKTIDFVVMFIQVIIQTTLIVDSLRRCSNTRKLRRQKPGREIIMFLIVTNVGMWIFNTFSYKSPDSLDERYVFYGKELWSILGHITLPLITFYRFHSSVCFADIWDSAYNPGLDH